MLNLDLKMEYKIKGTYDTKSECHYYLIEEHFKSINKLKKLNLILTLGTIY